MALLSASKLPYTLFKELSFQVQKESAKKKALFLVLSTKKPDHYCISSGTFNEETALPFFVEGTLRLDSTHVQYQQQLESVFIGDTRYSPACLESQGFITSACFKYLAETYIEVLAKATNTQVPTVDFDPAEFYRNTLFSAAMDRSSQTKILTLPATPQPLPLGSLETTIDIDSEEE
jgi:hypothetical protein